MNNVLSSFTLLALRALLFHYYRLWQQLTARITVTPNCRADEFSGWKFNIFIEMYKLCKYIFDKNSFIKQIRYRISKMFDGKKHALDVLTLATTKYPKINQNRWMSYGCDRWRWNWSFDFWRAWIKLHDIQLL